MEDERQLGKVRISGHLLLELLGLDPHEHIVHGTTDYDIEYTSRAITVVIEGEKMPKIVPGEVLERVEPFIDEDGISWPDQGED